jgi:prepilin-type N-terminal cleavage/methylation domain-containing protein/prepilin-type processing-associated H-X9-DG protein
MHYWQKKREKMTQRHSFDQKQGGFTLVEVLITIAVISILAMFLFPAINRAREGARRVSCLNNMRQLSMAFNLYATDNDRRLPLTVDGDNGVNIGSAWNYYTVFDGTGRASAFDMTKGSLFSYLKNPAIYICPSDGIGEYSLNSYAVNGCAFSDTEIDARKAGKRMTKFRDTAKWMLLSEESSTTDTLNTSTDDGYLSLPSANVTTTRHGGGSVTAFMDGHAKWFSSERIVEGGFQIGGGSPTTLGSNCP